MDTSLQPYPGIPSIANLIKHCCSSLASLRKIHSHIKHTTNLDSTNIYIANLLLSAYSSHGIHGITEARSLLAKLDRPTIKSWNILVAACVRQKHHRAALELYWSMNCDGRTVPDEITLVGLLTACASLGELATGRALHDRVLASGFDRSNAIVATAVVTMYFKCHRVDRAREVFDRMNNRTVVSWNTMITAYAQAEDLEQALFIFEIMDVERDCFTFSAILGACSTSKDLKAGRGIHQMIIASGIRLDVVASNALVSMYGGCGSIGEAREVFEAMETRDTVSWNALIVGYVQSGYGRPAIDLYKRMISTTNLKPNAVTFASVLAACSIAGDASGGRTIHRDVCSSRDYDFSISVQNSLVNFYARCGSFAEAASVFEGMRVRDLFSWNSILAACSRHHKCDEMELALQLQIQEGFQPDAVSYTCILHTCAHLGMPERSLQHFSSMRRDHWLQPLPEHYRCVLDLLGRAGLLREAQLLLDTMPFQPDEVAWKCLLSACNSHGEGGRGVTIARDVLWSEPEKSATYVLVSHSIRESEASK